MGSADSIISADFRRTHSIRSQRAFFPGWAPLEGKPIAVAKLHPWLEERALHLKAFKKMEQFSALAYLVNLNNILGNEEGR